MTDFDRVVLHSRLADSFGRACIVAADAATAKDKIRHKIVGYLDGAEAMLMSGSAYDVTVTSAKTRTLDVEALLADIARVTGLKPEVLAGIKARNTRETTSVRVCAKARVEREEAA
jgi:hypothetical protein